MRTIHYGLPLILLGAVLLFPACKGDTGAAGPTGASSVPAPLCTSPTASGVTVAGTVFSTGSGWLIANKITLAAASTAVSISLNIGSGAVTGQVRVGIYNDSGSAPSNLVAQSNPQILVASSWNQVAITDTYLPAGTYWLVFSLSNGANVTYVTSATNYYYCSYNWGVMPTTFPTGAFNNQSIVPSMYLSTCP